MARKSTIILAVGSAVYLLDRLTKLFIIRNLGLNESWTVVEGYFDITHIRNTGAAFGFLAFLDDTYRVPFFVATALAAMALLLYFVKKTRAEDSLMLIALALILGGAAGNLTDRILYGYVVDFVYWHVHGHYWPAFNIADSGITVGIALLGVEIFLRGKTVGAEG